MKFYQILAIFLNIIVNSSGFLLFLVAYQIYFLEIMVAWLLYSLTFVLYFVLMHFFECACIYCIFMYILSIYFPFLYYPLRLFTLTNIDTHLVPLLPEGVVFWFNLVWHQFWTDLGYFRGSLYIIITTIFYVNWFLAVWYHQDIRILPLGDIIATPSGAVLLGVLFFLFLFPWLPNHWAPNFPRWRPFLFIIFILFSVLYTFIGSYFLFSAPVYLPFVYINNVFTYII